MKSTSTLMTKHVANASFHVASAKDIKARSEKQLAALTTRVSNEKSKASGPLTGEALGRVVSQIDDMRKTLKDESAMEIKMRDTCIAEENQARQELERRYSEQSRLNITIIRFNTSIHDFNMEIGRIRGE